MSNALPADTIRSLPELILCVSALGILLTAKSWRSTTLLVAVVLTAVIGAGAALFTLAFHGAMLQEMFHGMLVRTPFIALLQGAILLVTAVTALLCLGYSLFRSIDWAELLGLLLLSTAGLLWVIGASNLILVYVGLELVSITSYLMVGFLRKEPTSAEAGLKYFLFGTLATAILLYGLSWIYGATGTLDLGSVQASISGGIHPNLSLLLVGLLFLTVGLGFKIALVPFHHWAPDAYEGAPTPVAAFISAGPKIAGFALLIRLFGVTFQGLTGYGSALLEAIAIATMTLGNLAALKQTNVKRLLAYSSIAQAGYIVIGVVTGTVGGVTAVLYYTFVYALMNLAAFGCVIAVSDATSRDDLGAYAGLAKKHPALAAAFAISLLSLAGIPPLAGFLAKFWIFWAALQNGKVLLAVVAAVNSVIAVYYYAGIIKEMYLKEPAATPVASPSSSSPAWPLTIAVGLCIAGVVLLGLWPNGLLSLLAAVLPTLL